MEILVTIPCGVVKDTFIPKWVENKINNLGNVTWNTQEYQYSKEQLMEAVRNKDICITGWQTPKFDRDVLNCADRLKMIAHTGGTVGPIVDDDAYERGIRIISGNNVYAESVAEGVLAYIMSSLRNIPGYNKRMHEGFWCEEGEYTYGIFDKTIGLVGFGATTKYLLTFLKPFHVKIKVFSEHLSLEDAAQFGVEKCGLNEIFSSCDIISLHSAMRADTYHMITDKLLSMIKPGALFVNTARGKLVDEHELCKQLKTKRFNAVIDVYEQEPLPEDSELRKLDNVILIPHMAGPTVDRRQYVTNALIEDIISFSSGGALKNEIVKSYSKVMTQTL